MGAELHELAQRLNTTRLYTVLDAMAFLACEEGRLEVAARLAVFSDAAHEAHGQARRTPAEERVRAEALSVLETHMGPAWRVAGSARREPLDEAGACSLALGLRA